MAFLYWVVFSLTRQAVHSLLKREANQALPGVKNKFICKESPLPNSQKNFLMSICTQSLCDELDAPVRWEQHAGCRTPDSNDCSSLSPGNAKVPWSCRNRVRLFLGTEQVAAACAYKLFSALPPLHLPPSLCSPPGAVFPLRSMGTGWAPASCHLASLTSPRALTFGTWWEGKGRAIRTPPRHRRLRSCARDRVGM